MTIEELYSIFKEHRTITTDSRKCICDSIFFALKGENFDGNKFALRALSEGCAYAVVDDPEVATDERIILVNNVLQTLQALARFHRRVLNIPVIAITGTNGKTTTKELTAACLSQKYNVLATEGNLNNHIGVPLTLLRLTKAHEIAVIEMGANHPGEIRALANIAEPNFGIITNVGKAHLQGFGSFEGVIRTKCELYDYIRQRGGHVFLHHENIFLQPRSEGLEKSEYGGTPGLFISGKLTNCSPYLSFDFIRQGGSLISVDTHLIGNYNLPNALAASAIAAYFEVPAMAIKKALEEYEPQNRRSQLLKTGNNTLILDAYNANPTSMNAALDNFVAMDVPHKAVILGDMGELGIDSEAEHRKIVDKLKNAGFDKVILSGMEFVRVAEGLECYPTTEALADSLKSDPLKGFTILVKGSRFMQLEKCIDLL
ncbi:UDP-N-acetylmuramoyl-tripeptide--D-alanyl-D-alanine ligase [Coprobacter sp.]|uniref:UDP-N-acetylmuramoyl-tripeptide--D-alanyl-D- alanine ligase n=1 Tax=Coprobacter sp. TaxID=1941478 RepID=UPI003AB3FBFD